MVLESTMICLDNSEYQRNGDYFPTRLNVQKDGANLVCHTKLRSNPENNVGLLTMSYSSQVLATLTSEAGRIFSKMEAVQPKGEISLVPSIRIAHLALKHRQGKNHKMRIVAFVGSPINVDESELVKLAKRLKKEKVNVDIISYGEHAHNNELLTVFVDTLNGKDGTGSHLVSVPRGSVLSEALLSSPIIQGEDGMGAAGLGGGAYEFGIDPNEDPELVLALRVSMEEQRQRQEEEQRRAQGEGGASAAAAAASAAPAATGGGEKPAAVAASSGGAPLAAAAAASSIDDDNSEEAMLQRAIAMSTETEEDNMPDFSTMTEEEQIAFAMQMSMQDADVTQQAKRPKTEETTQMDVDEDYSEVIGDPAFLQSVLENLPGVDPQSEAVRDAVGSLNKDKKNPDGEKK